MKIVNIEDEIPAANRIAKLLKNCNDDIEVINKLDSVEASVKYLPTAAAVDLIFMDIQLTDGLSFDIFEKVKVSTPVIFTTAFDQYTPKAFKVNSIDYLLKPIDESELEQSLKKHKQLYAKTDNNFSDKLVKMLRD